MSRLTPDDPAVLAAAVADSLVVAADEEGQVASLYYWHLSRPYVGEVVAQARAVAGAGLAHLVEDLLADPRDPRRYRALREAVQARIVTAPQTMAALTAAAWRAECNSRLGFHLGGRYPTDTAPVGWRTLAARPPGAAAPTGADPDVLVVIPFRDQTADGARVRNLLACLLALRDQSLARDSYQVTVVEADTEPRWRAVVEPYCDTYLHAHRDGPFNKSWAVNVGVVHSPGEPAVLCVHDADVLSDREFLARNRARFLAPGSGAHLPYQLMSCLNATSSAAAIRARVLAGAPAVDTALLRRFLLRRPPGACVWLRAEAFRRINGMDERYEGWGGEDNDLFFRADLDAPFLIFDDPLLHLHHPPASALLDGQVTNAHIAPLSWPVDRPIGELADGRIWLGPDPS